MLVLRYEVYSEDRFPKLFSYKKLFVRIAKYQNAKRAHCTKSESTKVPKCCTNIRLFKCDCMSKKIFWKYCFDPKLHVWFCYKIWKGVFRAHCTQIWGTSKVAFGRYMLVWHYHVYGKTDFQNYISTKSYLSVSQNIKMRNGLIAQKAKVLRCRNVVLILDFLSVTVWAKTILKILFRSKVTYMILL